MNKRLSVFFFIFSCLYCFVLIDRSFYNLSGDNLNIGTIVYHLLYSDNFSGEFVRIYKGSYYLPLFVNLVTLIQKHTDNYILTLQIVLFLQLFLSLLTTSYMIKTLFDGIGGLKNALLTLLISMSFVMLPCGEMIGFGTLYSAVARYFYSIFTPLLIVFYYKYEEISISGKKIPSIVIIGAVSGILINLHPPSAITTYSVFLFHWFFYRSGFFSNFKISFYPSMIKCTSSVLLFLVLSSIYSIPFVEYSRQMEKAPAAALVKMQKNISGTDKNRTEKTEHIPDGEKNETIQSIINRDTSSADADKIKNLADFSLYVYFNLKTFLFFLRQISFLAFIIPFIYFVFLFRKKDISALPQSQLLIFLRSLFITGFIICALGNIIAMNIKFGPYFEAFQRADRFLFLIFELLVIYLIFYGKSLVNSKVLYYFSACGLLFFWICLSKTKGLFQYNIISKVFPKIKIDTEIQTLAVNLLIIIAVVISIFIYHSNIFKKNISRKILLFTLLPVLYLWPLLSGGILTSVNHLLYSFNGLGAWSVIGKISSSKAHEKEEAFRKTCDWIRANTPVNSKMLFFDRKKSQNFKLCCRRDGICSPDEVGILPYIASNIKKIYDSDSKNISSEILKLVSKYKLQYVLLCKEDSDDINFPDNMKLLYDSKYYSFYCRTTSSKQKQ
ncbi:MAG: hypothetical protein A2017_19970 [Lentisphaerae bacterium GWF2_44_16]|nr:MAG: hypothetical protein A2017_19970 [Lentisphaerae bacterium GWF2_44_16]